MEITNASVFPQMQYDGSFVFQEIPTQILQFSNHFFFHRAV